MFEPGAGDPGYQRSYGLWWIEDKTNSYVAAITYSPQSTTGGYNELQFIIAASSGSNNFRQWNVQLDEPGTNSSTTEVAEGTNWSSVNDGSTNARGFIHLVFEYDDNQGIDEDKFKVYWNATLLTTNVFTTGAGGTGPTAIAYTGNQYAHFGISPIGGTATPYEAPWYGWIAWISFANNYAAGQSAVDTLYNSGETATQDDTINLDPGMIHYELGSPADPQYDYNGNSITLDVITAEHSTSEFP
jgi:hypothetical protein